MELILNYIMHLDQHIVSLIAQYGLWMYAILFLIIFCETGLVVAAFLPGDSLLFATGALSAQTDALNIHILFILLVAASILGNGLNYLIGKFLGNKLFKDNSFFFNKKYLKRAHAFYERFGGKTIILARFIPIIRTFAPFVAGLSAMSSKRFFLYNIIGAIAWIGSLLYASYLFGNIPLIKNHFSTMVLVIIFLSLLPVVFEIMRNTLLKARTSI